MKRDIKNLSIIGIISMFIFIFYFIIIPMNTKVEGIIISVFMIFTSLLSVMLLGYRKEKFNYKQKRIRITIIYEMIVCFLIMYGLGFIFGFLKNSYSLRLIRIIENLINPLILIITTEITRNVVIKANKDKKYITILITIVLIFIEMITSVTGYNLKTFSGVFVFVTMSLLPLITKHFMLSYLTSKASIKECLLYRLIVDLYIYVVPFVSDMGDYLTCMTNIIFPYIIYSSVSNIMTKEINSKQDLNATRFDATDVLVSAVIVFFFLLITGNIGYQILSIGSESMSPAINKGDAVVIDLNPKELRVNDVISYEYKGRNTIHRIISIDEGDKVIYHTRGDANTAEDHVEVTEDMIKGKVILRIKFLGYPPIWFQEFRS